MSHVTKCSTIRGVFQQPWPGVSPTAILNEEKALGTRLNLTSFSFPEPTICLVSGGIAGLWYQPLPSSPLPGGSDELGPGHKRWYWRMKNRGVWPRDVTYKSALEIQRKVNIWHPRKCLQSSFSKRTDQNNKRTKGMLHAIT